MSKPRTILMNSLMMPTEGLWYYPCRLTPEQFAERLKEEMRLGLVKSYIGYQATARIVEQLAGLPEGTIVVNRAQTSVRPMDTILVAKLKYRVRNPGDKGKLTPTLEDYEFFVVDVYGPEEIEIA